MADSPELHIEYSVQLALAHECFYEHRESAEFIALIDWDDLLITRQFPTVGLALAAAANAAPDADFFYVNKLQKSVVDWKCLLGF